jgi:dGTP triphosphohydrolase
VRSEDDLFSGSVEPEEVGKDKLETLSELCVKLKNTEQEIADLEEALAFKKKALEQISRFSIPSIFNELGLSQLKLNDGRVVEVEDKIVAKISEKHSLSAFRNMVETEKALLIQATGKEVLTNEELKELHQTAESRVDSLFKSSLKIEDFEDSLMDFLIDSGISYEYKKDIHWQTLRKYCRECLASGTEIPEGISVFQYQETKLK